MAGKQSYALSGHGREPAYIVVRSRSMEYPNAKKPKGGATTGYTVRPNYRNLGSVSWADIPADMVAELVTVTCNNGAAIMFGQTSDQGALSLCILDQQNKIKDYPRTETEVSSFLIWLKDEYFPTPISTKK